MNYYNEHDPYAADWLENLIRDGLISNGVIDRRDIQQVQPDELREFRQVHLFAGIGGWSLALRLAGWDDDTPVWTGSCPCQPFSCAGLGKGTADPRHLWPEMLRLITHCRPAICFGEQVESKDGRIWLNGVRADLEALGSGVGAADLCAAGIEAPHIRQRLFWMAHARFTGNEFELRHRQAYGENGTSESETQQRERCGAYIGGGIATSRLADARSSPPRRDSRSGGTGPASGSVEIERQRQADAESERCGQVGGLGHSPPRRFRIDGSAQRDGGHAAQPEPACGLGNTVNAGSQGLAGHGGNRDEPRRDGTLADRSISSAGSWSYRLGQPSIERSSGQRPSNGRPAEAAGSSWSDFYIVHCRDGKSRRIGSGVAPLAHGLPRSVGPEQSRSFGFHDLAAARKSLKAAKANRTGRIRGYGNAIVPQLAAEFISACREILRAD